MTIHQILHIPARQILLTIHFVLLSAQMALFLTSVRDERSRRIRILLAAHFLLGFGLFYLMMASIFREYDAPGIPDGYPAFLSAFGTLPSAMLILYEILTVSALLWILVDFIRYRKSHPTSRSIKETVDLLPVGIAFLREDGSTALHNLMMDELSQKISKNHLTTAYEIPYAQGGTRTIRIADPMEKESVWQISSEKADIDGKGFTQLVASDITEQSRITEELAEKHEKLRDIHMRLNIYNKQAERMIIAQELLTARMAVHNELGNVLLESRHYLNDTGSFDEAMLLRALKNTNTYLLREYEEDDSAGDPLTDALEMADAIGVEVTIAGVIPQTEPYRSVLAAAVMECATNTVKHADGTALLAEVTETDQGVTFNLSGDGKQPQGEIRESGGLKSLRALVEKEGGRMEIRLTPQLTITILLQMGRSAHDNHLPGLLH